MQHPASMPMPPVMLMEASEKKWYLPSFEPTVKGCTSSASTQHMLVTLGPPKVLPSGLSPMNRNM